MSLIFRHISFVLYRTHVTYAVEGKQLKLRASSLYSVGSEYHLIIRYKHIYTEVSVWVEWKG